MSVINKTPLINEILSGLDEDQLLDLKACINGEGPDFVFRSLKPNSPAALTEADYGVTPVKLELNFVRGGLSLYKGYLIYTEAMCFMICYTGDANQGLMILRINPSKFEAEITNGSLTITELRSELDDELDQYESGGSEEEHEPIILDLYYSDLEPVPGGAGLQIMNAEKNAILNDVFSLIRSKKAVYAIGNTPKYGDGNYQQVAYGMCEGNFNSIDIESALSFGLNAADNSMDANAVTFMAMGGGLYGIYWADITDYEGLLSKMASDSTACLHFEFRVMGDSSAVADPEKISIDIYFSDLNLLENGVPYIATPEIKEKVEKIVAASKNKKIVQGYMKFPYINDQFPVGTISGFTHYEKDATGWVENVALAGSISSTHEYEVGYCKWTMPQQPVIYSFVLNGLTQAQQEELIGYMSTNPDQKIVTEFVIAGSLSALGSGEGGGGEEIHGSNIIDLKFSGYLDNHGGFLHIYMLKDKFNEMLVASGKTQEQIISEFNNATSLEQFMFFNTMIGSHFEHVQSIYQSGNQYNFDGSVATDDSPERPVICLSSDIDDAENPTMWGIDVCYLYDLGSQDNVRYKSANLVYHNAGGEDTKSTLSISELDLGVASGSGSGDSSPILYKHSIPLLGTIDNPGDSPMTLSFLSKYDNFNATDLLTLSQHLVGKNDEHVIINPQMVDGENEKFAAISSIWPRDDNTGVDFVMTTSAKQVASIFCGFEDNTSITDTVTPYLMGGSGGSGSGSGTGTGSIKRYLTTLNFAYQNSYESNYSIAFAFFEKDLDDTIEILNQALAQAGISVVLTKSNWAATIPTLINQMLQSNSSAVVAAFTMLMNNAYQTYGTDLAGMYDDVGIAGGIRLADQVLDWQDIEFTTATLSELEDLEVSVSGGGSSGLTENPYCYVQLGVGSNHLIYLLDRKYTQDTTMVNNVNALITQLNSTFSVSIPSYAKIEDLETIASYINNLSGSTYAQLKVVFWSTVFATYQYYALSVKLYYLAAIFPVFISAESDPSQSAYSYNISTMNTAGTILTVWSESDTFNFVVRVDSLD